jgi:microcystin-dependent protein
MSSPFVAEIRIFGFQFAPKGWALCNGQIMPISQNTALFSLLGTTYGGDGKSTFALPNLQGNAAMQPGQGNGLSLRDLGETGGSPNVTLIQSELPFHDHFMTAWASDLGNLLGPNGNVTSILCRSANGAVFNASVNTVTQMAPQALAPAGGGLPHNNMQPYLTLNFCIALQGVFPPRP